MIPIGDENRGRRRTPVVVIGLILVNVAVFVYQLTLAAEPNVAACLVQWAPREVAPGNALDCFVYRWGVRPFEIRNVADVQPLSDGPIWLTVFSSMFMHGGWLHILGNMLFLWVFGDNVEDVMGHARFLLFYLLCGIGAAGLQIALDTSSLTPMVGASGAISGVMAAYLLLFPGGRVRVLIFLIIIPLIVTLPAIVVIGFWIVTQFVNGFGSLGPQTAQTDGVAYWAHVGGIITGLLLVFLFRDARAHRRARALQAGYRGYRG